jgi:lysophospholipase L1-like esterase
VYLLFLAIIPFVKMTKMILNFSIAILGFICQLLFSCKREEPVSPFYYTGWDTTYNAGSLVLPDASMLQRSIINAGDAGRMNLFFNKVRSSGEIRIGYIGGSITERYNASSYEKCYPVLLCDFLKKTFGAINFIPLNKGIGATGSRFGCSRVRDDLLSQKPDVIIIEYSVNDRIDDSLEVKGTMEGLVRQCLNSGAEVMMLCMMSRDGDDAVQKLHYSIGKHYNIPVISYFSALKPLLQSGAIEWNIIGSDEIHPNDLGHFVSAALLYKYLRSSFLNSGEVNTGIPSTPHYLITDLYESASVVNKTDMMRILTSNQGWNTKTNEYDRMEFLSAHSGDKIKVRTHWRELTLLYWCENSQNGSAEISLDGQPVDTLANNSINNWGGYMKKERVFLDNNVTSHTIEIRNLSNEPFDIKYILYAP